MASSPAPAHRELAADRLARLDDEFQRRACRTRRRGLVAGTAAIFLIIGVVVADGLGLVAAVGVDSSTVVASAGGTTLEVRHPDITRPALASPFEIRIRRDGGFGGQPVEVAVSTDYLLLWDLNGVIPSPAEETAGTDEVVWTFEPPNGDELRIVYEARIEPGAQQGEEGRVAVLDDDGSELVAVEFETRVRP